MKIVAFVPIKLKSQRLPNKMLLPLGEGKILCQHIFNTLLEVKKVIDLDIYCYCSDETIIQYLPTDIFFLKRSNALDSDETKGMDIYQSFVNTINSDIYLLCHATSPYIKKESILKGLNSIMIYGYDSAFSCSKVKTFCWYNDKPLNYNLDNIIRTQDIEPVYWETSAFYMFTKDVIRNKKRIGVNSYKVETDRIESIDIDELEDYQIALKCF